MMIRFISHRRILLTLCTIVLVYAGLPVSVPAQAADVPLSLKAMKQKLYEARVAAGDLDSKGSVPATAPAGMTALSASALIPGTVTLFDSFRSGNWEIYSAGGGDSVTQLTNHPAVDVLPRLSKNGARVAFVSRRDGNYEIYSMNPNGSGQTRVTNHSAVDTEPEWMAGNNALVFASNRNGTFDIWAVNADGTNPQPFAARGDTDEFDPAVSPDGTQTSWVQAPWVTGDDRGVIITRGPGGDGQSWPPCAYMARPRWSPDGTRLAYECDIDGDNWNEIVIRESGGTLSTIDLNETFVDAQMNAWTPDGTSIVFTRVQYQVSSNQLVVVSFIPLIASAAAQSTPAILPFATGADTSVDIRWNDTSPPVTAFVNPPKFLQAGSASQLNWVSRDNGPAGILDYFLEYNADDGGWQQLLGGSKLTSFPLYVPGNAQKKVVWRVWARDRAGNVEPAPTSGANVAEVLIYTDSISGTLTDNRNVPVVGLALQASSSIPPSVTTSASGQFLFPFAAASPASTHVVTINKPGYAPYPPVDNASARGMQVFRPYLHDLGNVVTNGRFDLASSGWSTTGNVTFGSIGIPGIGVPHALLSGSGSAISQHVTLPANMHKPTLSFVFTTNFFSAGSNDGPTLAVRVDDGTTQSVVASFQQSSGGLQPINAPSTLGFVDMQPWLGKAVTLTLEVTGTNVAFAQAVLDDVSLSSWNTPVPRTVSPARLASIAPSATITITGENFIAPVQVRAGNTLLQNVQWVDERTIIATLPTNLPFGRHDLYVTNAGGQENTLPNAIIVGTESYLPIALR